ncbi:hypothetical protein QUF50_01195 [Thiotrichales bacterium HSG1]|nr:hypothetical protein [Thiotrichales bacterium HSG1]
MKEGSMRKLAKRFKVPGKFVFTLIKQFNEIGSIKGIAIMVVNQQQMLKVKTLYENY